MEGVVSVQSQPQAKIRQQWEIRCQHWGCIEQSQVVMSHHQVHHESAPVVKGSDESALGGDQSAMGNDESPIGIHESAPDCAKSALVR